MCALFPGCFFFIMGLKPPAPAQLSQEVLTAARRARARSVVETRPGKSAGSLFGLQFRSLFERPSYRSSLVIFTAPIP